LYQRQSVESVTSVSQANARKPSQDEREFVYARELVPLLAFRGFSAFACIARCRYAFLLGYRWSMAGIKMSWFI
jgi:hypothetical protein